MDWFLSENRTSSPDGVIVAINLAYLGKTNVIEILGEFLIFSISKSRKLNDIQCPNCQ